MTRLALTPEVVLRVPLLQPLPQPLRGEIRSPPSPSIYVVVSGQSQSKGVLSEIMEDYRYEAKLTAARQVNTG
jgi:hypothetical protein